MRNGWSFKSPRASGQIEARDRTTGSRALRVVQVREELAVARHQARAHVSAKRGSISFIVVAIVVDYDASSRQTAGRFIHY